MGSPRRPQTQQGQVRVRHRVQGGRVVHRALRGEGRHRQTRENGEGGRNEGPESRQKGEVFLNQVCLTEDNLNKKVRFYLLCKTKQNENLCTQLLEYYLRIFST